MKIVDGNSLGALANAVSGAGAAAAGTGPRPGQRVDGSAASDSAEVSGLASQLIDAVSGDSPDRAARVQALRAAVGAGTYSVDSTAVARGVIKDALAGDGTDCGS